MVDGFGIKLSTLSSRSRTCCEFMDQLARILNTAFDWATKLGVALHNVIEEFLRWKPSFKGMDLLSNADMGSNFAPVSVGGSALNTGQAAAMLPSRAGGAWSVTLNITGARDAVEVGRQAEAGVLRAARAMGVR